MTKSNLTPLLARNSVESTGDSRESDDNEEELTSYTETELAANEREQKQRTEQAAADEIKAKQKEQADKGVALYSKSGSSEDIDFAHEILAELSEVDEMFRYPISESTTLQGVMKDVAPTFRYIGEDTHLDGQEDFGAEKKLLFKNEQGKPFDIYVRGNELWIDVSRFNTGEGGAAVYAAVGNYAVNTGNVFIADPHSLSDDAAIRRTSAMLSLALRFGSTDFMEPGQKQLKGIPEIGVKPLKWTGSDVDRTKSLIDTFLSNLEHSFPELKNVRYDFNKRDFLREDNGMPVHWGEMESHRRRRGFGVAARAGEATARRGAFIRSLISSESSQRPGILEQVLNGSRSLVKNGNLERVFSKSTSTTGSTIAKVKSWLPARVAKLVASGKLEVVQDAKDAPATATSFDAGGIEGYYDTQADKLYIIASSVTKDSLPSVLAHELTHRALATDPKLKAATAKFDTDLQNRFNLAAKGIGTPLELAAYKRVVSAETPLKDQLEEFKSYINTEYTKTPDSFTGKLKRIFDDFIAAIRMALVRNGLDFGYIKTLTPANLFALSKYGARVQPLGANAHNGSEVLASFAGKHAKTADKYQLSSAQQRLDAGENAEIVRQDTGWFKGVDDKWRFEINDNNARFVGGLINKDGTLDISNKKLGDILNHPHLFSAYPSLAESIVDLHIGSQFANEGSYYRPDDRKIVVNAATRADALTFLLHEIQHGIQHIEDFAWGGSLDANKKRKETNYEKKQKLIAEQAKYAKDFYDARDSYHKKLAHIRTLNLPKGVEDARIKEAWVDNDGSKKYTELQKEIQAINAHAFDPATLVLPPSREEYAKLFLDYQRHAGEIEARNVESRQNFTKKKRELISPSSTQDIADSDAIIVFNGKEMRGAPAPDNASKTNSLESTERLAPDGIRFSRAGDAISSLLPEEAKRIETAFSRTAGGTKAQSFGLLTLRQIADVTSKVLPQIQKVFIKNIHAMDTEKNKRLSAAGEIATAWAKLPEAISNEMSDLMHDSTIAGVDGGKAYVPVIDIPVALAKIQTINKRMIGMPGERKEQMMQERKELYMMIDFEKKRKLAYPEIKNRFNALARKSPDAAKIYNESRDHHEKHFTDTLEALKERIGESKASPEVKKNLIAKLRLKFESLQAQAPYFPLARFGDYWVHTKEGEETRFDMFESEAEQSAFINQMDREGISVMGSGKQLENLSEIDGVSAEFITEVDSLISSLGDVPIVNDLRDSVYQLYLNSLPDVSARKHLIHRKKTKGFHQDQLRAFAKKALHDANNLAKLKYGYKLQATLDESKKIIEIASSKSKRDKATLLLTMIDEYLSADMTLAEINTRLGKTTDDAEHEMLVQFKKWKNGYSTAALNDLYDHTQHILDLSKNIERDDRVFAVNALNELRKSYKDIMNPKTHPLAQRLNSLGFAWYLGLTPAASLVNITQTPVVALPLLAAKVGWGNASKAMLDVTKLFFKNVKAGKKDGMPWVNGLSIKDELTGNELKAYESWIDSGLLDVTLAHDLAGLSDEGILTNTGKHKLMNVLSFGFHHAERMNREITALASYRAAINKGMSHNDAAEFASKLVLDSHFDYTSSNRARFMRGNVARVVTQFKQYSQNLTYLYARTIQQAYGNSSPEEKAEARKALKGLLIMQSAVAGTLGLPMVGVMMGMAQALSDVGGDDDEPEDIEGNYRQLLADLVTSVTGSTEAGNKFSLIMSKGLIDGLTPFSVAGRLSASDLWIRSSDKELEGTDRAWDWAKTLLGPMAGLLLENPAVAMSMMSDGHYERGIEHMMPKAIKDGMKAIRFSTEGVENLRGDQITEDYSIIEGVGQILGFSSSEISDIYDQNNAIKRIKTKLDDRRQSLLTEAAKTKMGRDSEAYSAVAAEIKAFNAKNPARKITGVNILQSIKGRKRRSKETDNGLYLSKRDKGLADKYRFAEE